MKIRIALNAKKQASKHHANVTNILKAKKFMSDGCAEIYEIWIGLNGIYVNYIITGM